MELTHRRLLPF